MWQQSICTSSNDYIKPVLIELLVGYPSLPPVDKVDPEEGAEYMHVL